MAPQPFLPANRGKHFCFDERGLQANAPAAALLGQILGEWSRVEHQSAMLMAALIGDNPRPGLALFTSLRGSRAQRDALSAVVSVCTYQDMVPVITALQGIQESLAKERNKIVHGLFGWSFDLPGSTIIVHSDRIADYEAAAWIKSQDGSLRDHHDLEKQMFTYTHDDFSDILQRMAELKLLLSYMYSIIRHGKDKQENMYRALIENEAVKARL